MHNHRFFCIHPKLYLKDITQDSTPDTFHEYEAISITEDQHLSTSSCVSWNRELRNRNYLRIEFVYFDAIHQRVLILLRKLISDTHSSDASFTGSGRSCTYSNHQKIEFVSELLSFPLQTSTSFGLDFATATRISFQNKKMRPRQILGLLHGCLVMSMNQGANSKTSVLMENVEHTCEFDLLADIINIPKEENRRDIPDPWLLPLPNQQFALCLNTEAYLFNETRRTFDTVIRILDDKRKESVPLTSSWHQQSIYDHFYAQDKYASLQNGYELVINQSGACWQLFYNFEEGVIYRSVLHWMPDPSKVCALTELNGIIVDLNDNLTHLESQMTFKCVIYFPETNDLIPIRIGGNSESSKKPKLLLETIHVQCACLSAVYYIPSVGIALRDNTDQLHLISIEKLKKATKLPLNQFVDFEQMEQDSKFKCYAVPPVEKEGFEMLPLTKLPDHMQNNAYEECKKFAFVITRGYDTIDYNNYILVAGFNCQQNLPFNEIKSKDYKELTTFSELGDYIGAPVFYMSSYSSSIQLGCILGFNKNQRSSNSIFIGHVSQGSSGSSHVTAKSCKWIGIVKFVGDKFFEKKQSLHASTSILDKDYFEIVSNKAILADPCNDRNWIRVILPNVKNGKWFYKTLGTDPVEQLLAYHESASLTKEELFSVPKELYSYWEDDLGNPCESDTKEISDTLRNQVYSVHAYPSLPFWHKVWAGVGVDTARAGIFDESHYYDESVAPKYKQGQVGWLQHFQAGYSDNAWSKMVDEKTENRSLSEIPFGVISMSGYGDGSYQSIVKIDPPTKEIVAIRIIYVSHIH